RRDNPTALDRYFEVIDQTSVNGRPDWDAVDAWYAQQSAEDRAFIDRNTGISGSPLMKLRRKAQAEYYNLPRYRRFTAEEGFAIDALWQEARNLAGSDDRFAMLRA